MPDLPADPAALRVAMRDDLVSHLSGFMTKWNTEIVADGIMADLSDRWDLDDWLAHLARRDEEVRSRKDYAEWTRRPR